MPDPIHIDRSKMTRTETELATTPVKSISPKLLDAPKLVARIQGWHGAREAIDATIAGAAEYPQIAMRYDLGDCATCKGNSLKPADSQEVVRLDLKCPICNRLLHPFGCTGCKCNGGSVVAMRLLTEPEPGMPPEIDQNSGHAYPLIKVLVMDHGVARPNLADRAWTEIEKYALGRNPLSIVGTSVSSRDSRRAHYWRLEV